MFVLATTPFGTQFSFRRHFEQRNCSLPLLVWPTVLFQMVACVYTVEKCSARSRLSIASALHLCKSGHCNLHVVLFILEQFFSLIWVFFATSMPFKFAMFWYDCKFCNRLLLNQQDRHRAIVHSESCNHTCRNFWQYCFGLQGSFFPGITSWRNWTTWKYRVVE